MLSIVNLTILTVLICLKGGNASKVERADLIVTDHDLNVAIKFAEDSLSRLERLEGSLRASNIDVKDDSPSHGQLIGSYPTPEALSHGRQAMIVNKASGYLVHRHCKIRHLSTTDCLVAMKNWTLNETPLRKKCAIQFSTMPCNPASKYRSFDGSCNHVAHPSWGQSYSPYRRMLPAHYADGIMEPKKSITRRPLPSPRQISNILVPDVDKTEKSTTLALAQWAQFIANDLFHTPTMKMVHTGSSIVCCRPDGRSLSPRHIHPSCFQIPIPEADPDYSIHRATCMNYVRSVTSMRSTCNFGPADQMNQATHFLDGSNIYGSSSTRNIGLRAMTGGRLVTSVGSDDYEYLPLSQVPEVMCQTSNNDTVCYSSGDSRVNEHPHHTALYTVWVREHNRLADALHDINPYWDDNTLFQEARRIVIAQIQHITYHIWAPHILGAAYAKRLKLDTKSKGFGGSFSEDVDPSVSNSFATAGMTFINSMFQREIRLYDEEREVTQSLSLKDNFNKPAITVQPGAIDGLLRGLSSQLSQKVDASFIEDVTSQLYRGEAPFGLDAMSLDIQRGRDHGLPGYNAFRRYCNLPSSSKFDSFLDTIPKTHVNKLKSLYAHPDDVDLVVGGILEAPIDGGKLGPTLKCIVEEQLARTRKGDPFFYDLHGYPQSFTEIQIKELKKASLARVLCDNAATISSMQPDVFTTPSGNNPILDCEDTRIPAINLNAWKENKV